MLKVLVIDDEELVRKGIVIGTDWKSLGCVVVCDSANGEEGLIAVEKYQPDLIISDIKMPKMDGITMLSKLRENGYDTPVIFLTAYSDFSYAQQAVRFSATDYLLKPFEDGQLEEAVKANGSDCGIIYDGDADRVLFIDEKGRFIQPDYTTSIIGDYYLSKEKGSCLVDIRTSRSTTEYLAKKGATEVIIWKVGHAYAKDKIRERGCIFGGELAGHYYFRDFFNCDSGILASLLVLQTVAKLHEEGKTLSQMLDSIRVYANSGENNFRLEQKDEAMAALYDKYSKLNPDKIIDFDGYRIEFPTWWFNVRKSNTEPFLRLVAEAKTQEELDEHFADLSAIIKKFK